MKYEPLILNNLTVFVQFDDKADALCREHNTPTKQIEVALAEHLEHSTPAKLLVSCSANHDSIIILSVSDILRDFTYEHYKDKHFYTFK